MSKVYLAVMARFFQLIKFQRDVLIVIYFFGLMFISFLLGMLLFQCNHAG